LDEDKDKLIDPETDESKALDWILNKDPMQVTPTSPNLIQRYLMVYFYYHTSHNRPWLNCNPPKGKQRDTCELYTGRHMETKYRWLSSIDECRWGGVYCDAGRVVELELPGQRLSGTFPHLITKMPYLKSLYLGQK